MKTLLIAFVALTLTGAAAAQTMATKLYVDMVLEADIALKSPQVYHGISSAGCAQAVTLADNRSLTIVWQHQVNDGFGCGACVEEWKLDPTNAPVRWHKKNQPKFKSGLRVYPSCIGAKGWGVWHSATAEQ